jgi:hypothetical protein
MGARKGRRGVFQQADPFYALGCIMDQGVWEIALNENNRAVVALQAGFVVGGVVGFDGAFAAFSMLFDP